MGSGDEAMTGRRLRLDRETLRDLAPTAEDAAAVRGGDDDSATKGCIMPAVENLLGQTMMSYGCRGRIKVEMTDTGQEIHVDLQPNDAVLEALEIFKQQAIARNPDLSNRLDQIKIQRPQ